MYVVYLYICKCKYDRMCTAACLHVYTIYMSISHRYGIYSYISTWYLLIYIDMCTIYVSIYHVAHAHE